MEAPSSDSFNLATIKPTELENLPEKVRGRVLNLMQSHQNQESQKLFERIYPEEDTPWLGPSIQGGLIEQGQILHSRHKYPRHMEFFEASKTHRELCFMAANRVGKTLSGGGYALACHLTGIYPDWWPGRKFYRPITAWAAGDTYETTRDIVQLTLLGEVAYRDGRKVMDGRGIIPGHVLGRNTWRSGVQDLIDMVVIKHSSGGWSKLGLKSYDQGRKAFQGTGRHVIWFDEEPPMDVYNEALIRTATVHGMIMITFTPLSGLSEVVLSFMPSSMRPATD